MTLRWWDRKFRPKQTSKTCDTCQLRKLRFDQKSIQHTRCMFCLTSGQGLPYHTQIKN